MKAAHSRELGWTRARVVARTLLAAGLLVAVSLAGCGSNQNHEEREAWAASIGQVEDPGCINTCRPDPGSRAVDCELEEEGLEFLEVWSTERIGMSQVPEAQDVYTYTDETTLFFEPRGYSPPTEPVQRCGESHALHLRGGPFLAWGGGLGTSMRNGLSVETECGGVAQNEEVDFCRPPDSEWVDAAADLSEWEGVSFWARKGPDGQPGLRVLIGDQYTSDDLSFLRLARTPDVPRNCERNLQCNCKAKDRECTWMPTNTCGNWGYSPARPDMVQICLLPGEADAIDCDYPYQVCGPSACDWEHDSYNDVTWDEHPGLPIGADPQFYGRACTEYSFRGSITESLCFTPGEDPPPVESNELCGDHWMAPVTLTTDWQFYKVPFTTLLQQGWAKESDKLDLTTVADLRFTWDRGWLDLYLDDVRFYRKARAEEE